MTVSTFDTPATHAPCCCSIAHGRDETDLLRTLVADGMDQQQASLLLWGEPAGATLTVATVGAWVRARLQVALPWLQLPDRAAV
jgi:hypothetical protein